MNTTKQPSKHSTKLKTHLKIRPVSALDSAISHPRVGDTVYLPSHKTTILVGTTYLGGPERIKDTTGDLWIVGRNMSTGINPAKFVAIV